MFYYLVQVVTGYTCPWETTENIFKEFIIETPDDKSIEEIKKILLNGKLSTYESEYEYDYETENYTEIVVRKISKESLYA